MSDNKKKCFVVTPIGDDNSDIRRHIDGIIDQAIKPAIGEKYDIIVSHREFKIGSINNRIIQRVYESDLVIANLTTTNPNVMYELAIRYSSGKPAIVIAEEGTKLPFDVIDENTIFYVNDPSGANELKNKICETEKKIDLAKNDYGPVCKAINKIPLYNEVESGAVTGEDVPSEKMMQYIIDRLDKIEDKLIFTGLTKEENNLSNIEKWIYEFKINDVSNCTSILNAILKATDVFWDVFCIHNEIKEENGNILYLVTLKGTIRNLYNVLSTIDTWALKNNIIYSYKIINK